MVSEEEVKILAANLFNKKLAASMYDAMEKAKSILNFSSQKKAVDDEEFWRESREIKEEQSRKAAEIKEEPKSEKFHEELKDLETLNSPAQEQKEDISAWEAGMNNENMTLNEMIKDANAGEESQPEDPKIQQILEETQAIKEEIKEAEQNPEIVEQVKEDISQVKEQLRQLEEERESKQQSQEENNENAGIPEEEKKEKPL